MIQRLDTWIDTREKRYFLFGTITMVLMILLFLPYLLLSIRLFTLNTYEDVFALLKNPLISWTYVSRVILLCLQEPQLSFSVMMPILFRALRIFELFAYGCWLLLCHRSKLRRYRRALHLFLLLFLCICSFCFMTVFSCGTLNTALGMIRYLALPMGVLACYVLILCSILLCSYYIPHYHKALSYEVVELSGADLQMMTQTNKKDMEVE